MEAEPSFLTQRQNAVGGTMKIGFIDHFIDEWHANNYPAWIAEASKGQDVIALAWAATDKPGGRTTAQWCADFGVGLADSLQQVADDCDALVVLSPDNPEHHPALCAVPFASGKPVYVDKTFAIDTATARGLFAQAAAGGTPVYSASALRYADEILARDAAFANPADVVAVDVRGPGELPNYSVHQLEMVAALMGTGAKRVRWEANTLAIDFGNRRATITLGADDFAFDAANRAGQTWTVPVCHNYFPNFIAAMLEFFHTREPAVPAAETMEIMAIREAGLAAQKNPGQWVELPA